MTTLQRVDDETTGDTESIESAERAGQPTEASAAPTPEQTPHPTPNPSDKPEPSSTPTDAVDLLSRIVAERPNGEVRPQQEHMVRLVEDAIKNNTHLLVQAGTGTGKSLGYLIPAIMQAKATDKRVVVSTATKQLGEQIVTEDMPVLATTIPKVGGDDFTYALIKGRNNYLCRREVDSLVRMDEEAGGGEQDGLFADPTPRENSRRPSADDLKKLNSLLQWADTTQTGDRTDAPAVPDKVWDQVSTDAAGCAGKACPFYDECFAEFARATAREADVVVTNHAQVAQDLNSEFPLLGEWDVLITDEVHELESYLSSAWGLEVSPSAMRHHIAQAARKLPRGDRTDYSQAREEAVKVIEDLDALSDALSEAAEGLMPQMPQNIGALLVTIANRLRTIIQAFKLSSEEGGIGQNIAADRKGAGQKMTHLALAVAEMCEDMSDGTRVRWLEPGFGTRSPVLKVAPLWIGPKLMTLLGSRTLIATSATMTVGGTFDSFIRTLALSEDITDDEGKTHKPRNFAAVDVGTPFDYDKQAILYIPTLDFPAPVGQDRFAHTEAVLNEVTALAKAAGGRTLALFTTRKGAENAAFHLRANLNTPVLCQGDAPPSQLIEEFKNDEHATLCATMGFWHGVNAPGATCFPPGTLVRTAKGYKPIETIEVGDRVWTHNRRYRKVTTVMSRKYSGEMVTVTPFGGSPVSMTPEHPVLVSDYKRQSGRHRQSAISQRWVEAGDLTGAEQLVLPVGDSFREYKPVGRKHLTGHKQARAEQVWQESPEFWELVGLWTAEGSISREEMPRKRAGAHKVRWQVSFGFGAHEEETLAARAADLIEKVFGINRPRPRVYGSACHVTMRHDPFAHWLKKNVGHLATGKHVPLRLLRSPSLDYKRAFIDGYCAGDGSDDPRDGSREATTASLDLALGVRDLALTCGYTASIYPRKNGKDAYKADGEYWRVRWQPGRSNRAALVSKRGSDESTAGDIKYMVAKPRAVERTYYDGLVYNLSVDRDESYTLPAFAVHNCTLVITDKVPFPRMDDPLMSARKDAVDRDRRGQGFNEVYVAAASVMLSQGVGRLIRTATDKGVVAVLDTRLLTKGYGRTMLSSLPQMRLIQDRTIIEGALGRLAEAADAAMDEAGASKSGGSASAARAAGTGRSTEPVPHVPARKAAPSKASTRALARSTKRA